MKNVIITGGTGGIGQELCKKFFSEGYNVYFIFLSNEKIAQELESMSSEFQKIKGFKCDVSKSESIVLAMNEIFAMCANVDVLINNVGVSMDSLLLDMTSDTWEKVIAVNLSSVFYITQYVAKKMMEAGAGSIVNISSIMGSIGWAGLSHYSAAKAGVEAFTRTASVELGRFGIRINSVAPGMIDTDMSSDARIKLGKKIKKITPLRRYGKVEEVSNLVFFLSTEQSSYTTGENYFIRGGLGAALSIS